MATVIDNLPQECRQLYGNVAGTNIFLNTPDFPDFADAIDYSCNTKDMICFKRLEEKKSEFGGDNIKST